MVFGDIDLLGRSLLSILLNTYLTVDRKGTLRVSGSQFFQIITLHLLGILIAVNVDSTKVQSNPVVLDLLGNSSNSGLSVALPNLKQR